MFSLPSASTIIGTVSSTNPSASTGIVAWSPTFVTAFIPVIYLVLGLVVAVALVKFTQRSVGKGIRGVTRR